MYFEINACVSGGGAYTSGKERLCDNEMRLVFVMGGSSSTMDGLVTNVHESLCFVRQGSRRKTGPQRATLASLLNAWKMEVLGASNTGMLASQSWNRADLSHPSLLLVLTP